MYVICSNDDFGKKSLQHIHGVMNEINNINGSLIYDISNITNEIDEIITKITNDTTIFVFIDKCDVIEAFVSEWSNRNRDNIVFIYGLDPFCFNTYDNVYILYNSGKIIIL